MKYKQKQLYGLKPLKPSNIQTTFENNIGLH